MEIATSDLEDDRHAALIEAREAQGGEKVEYSIRKAKSAHGLGGNVHSPFQTASSSGREDRRHQESPMKGRLGYSTAK